ncbi:dicarboxylate/amino acid:cation symporter [Soonwooa sp.]|uniref:dicarboxylate/amino acid:cation symporter n=1 Tax=Soonwooa sp. TaxID=1938592 RepID=UPI00262F217B|nr:dicarboxylate/amino acid:cation symporter [Soonwooa sp.]
METSPTSFWESYSNIILLIIGITVGSIVGIAMPDYVHYLKPLGDVFLNLLFVTVIPLVFFAIVTSVASIEQKGKLGKILFAMGITFLCFIVLAAIFTLIAVYLFPTTKPDVNLTSQIHEMGSDGEGWGDRMVKFFTVGEFYQLLSRQNMLPLLIFSFLLGISIRNVPEEKISTFKKFLDGANEAMKALLILLMKAAPIGLGAYIAYQVGTIGPQLFGFYAKPLGVYYGVGIVYFFTFYTLYAFIGRGPKGISLFWKNNILPSFTAVSTCSSLATMPVNLEAARRIGIPDSVANVVITIGTTIHKNGSSISSIVKIYVVFLIMGWDLFTTHNLLIAVGLTVFVSMVEGGIPNGGYIGEMLMISAYNLPQEAIPAVMIIGTLVDPLATILNATGNTVAAMVVTRLVGEKYNPPIS